MRNPRMGCLVVLGLLALFVLVFFNGGRQDGAVQLPSDMNGTMDGGTGMDSNGNSDSSTGGDGELEALGDMDESDGNLGSLDGSDGDGGSGAGLGELSEVIETQVSDVGYEVFEAFTAGESIDDLDAATGQFVVVSMALENRGDVPLTYLGSNMVDDRGQEYSYISEAIPYIEDDAVCENVTIEPGEERVCTMVYDVSSDASAVGLILTDLNLLGAEEETVELLGLP